jgi:hypothetical protein
MRYAVARGKSSTRLDRVDGRPLASSCPEPAKAQSPHVRQMRDSGQKAASPSDRTPLAPCLIDCCHITRANLNTGSTLHRDIDSGRRRTWCPHKRTGYSIGPEQLAQIRSFSLLLSSLDPPLGARAGRAVFHLLQDIRDIAARFSRQGTERAVHLLLFPRDIPPPRQGLPPSNALQR